MKKICIVVASIGKNVELAGEIEASLKSKNIETSTLNLVEINLPLYSTAAEAQHSAEQLIKPHLNHLSADGFVFVSPEYNGSTPPVINNFVAWVSRSTKNWRETFNSKPCMIATHSAGNGTQMLAILRLQLSYVGMNVIGRQILSTLSRPHQTQEVHDTCDVLIKALR